MSRHQSVNLNHLSRVVLLALTLSVAPLGAQVPEGWYATSHFKFCEWSAAGRVLLIDPDTGDRFEVKGLPDDIRSVPCVGTLQGAASILVRPEDGALIVGEGTTPGNDLEIFVLELDGFAVERTTRYRVGTMVGDGEVPQMAFIGDGRVLFCYYAVAEGQGLGVLDPSAGQESVRLFHWPARSPFALAVDLDADVAYFAEYGTSRIFAVYVSDLLESGEIEMEAWHAATVRIDDVNSLAMSPEGRVLAVGFGAQAGLFSIDPGTGTVERLCTNIDGVNSDANALIFDRRRGEIVVHFGGPTNNTELSGNVAGFTLEDGSCSIERRAMSWSGSEGILSGIAVNEGVGSSPLTFVRGDCNDDGSVDLADAICTLNWLFAGGKAPACLAVVNANGDETGDIADATYLLTFLFDGGAAPVAPFPDCGPPELDADRVLGCERSQEHCE